MSENLIIKRHAGLLIRHPIFRSTGIFIAATGVLWLLFKLPPAIVYLVDPLALSQARLVTAILQLLGQPVYQIGTIVSSAVIDMEITPACTGLYQLLVLITGMFAWPATARQRVRGIAFGALILMGINIFRIVSIYFTALTIPGWVPFIHGILWEVVMVLFVPLIWIYWIRRLSTGNKR